MRKKKGQDEMFFEIWRLLFAYRFGFKINFSEFVFPLAQGNLVLPILMPRELTRGKVGFMDRIVGVCKDSLSSVGMGYYCDSDAIVYNDRAPRDISYVIKVGNHQEATDGDDALKNLSAMAIRERASRTMTLPERLIQELYIIHTTGGCLDRRAMTLCAGSRYEHGDAPHVCWRGGRLKVCYCSPDSRSGYLRARAVVF